MDKQNFKKKWKRCAICHEAQSELLDVHRIEFGKDYSESNCLCLCVKCHRKIHSNLIHIKEKRYSTYGWILIYSEGKNEIIKNID